MKLEEKELINITGGGTSITGSILNYFSTAVKTIFTVGQSMGGAIRRIASGNVCPIQ